MSPEDRRKLNEVYDFIQLLKSSSTIPLDVDRAFRKRLNVGESDFDVELQVPTDTSNMQKTVNEGGAATYNVMNMPDEVGIIELEDGTQMSIPLYNLP